MVIPTGCDQVPGSPGTRSAQCSAFLLLTWSAGTNAASRRLPNDIVGGDRRDRWLSLSASRPVTEHNRQRLCPGLQYIWGGVVLKRSGAIHAGQSTQRSGFCRASHECDPELEPERQPWRPLPKLSVRPITSCSSISSVAVTTVVDYGVIACTQYYYRARNRNGRSVATDYPERSTSPRKPRRLGAFQSHRRAPLTGNRFRLIASPSEGVTQYKLYEVGTGTGSYGAAIAVFGSDGDELYDRSCP